MSGCRAGFTVLEALTAVILLGLLAVAVVPLLRGSASAALPERMQAAAWLATFAVPADPSAWQGRAIPDRPGWRLRISGLVADPEPAPPPGVAPPAGPARRWLLVAVVDGGDTVLAETLVAILPPEAPR